MIQNKVFLDTSYSIAGAVGKDEFHKRARELAAQIKTKGIEIITTQAIVLEIGNALSKLKYRQAAVKIIDSLESDLNTTIISLTPELYNEGFKLFRSRPDKEWSLADCISFLVMRERNIEAAMTTDEHFIQAEFRALLREK